MEDRSSLALQGLAVVATAATIWLISFSWLAIGPVDSAVAGGLLLAGAVGSSLLACGPSKAIGPFALHRVAVVAAGFGALMSLGLVISAAANDAPTYLEDRLLALPRFVLFFLLAYTIIVSIQAWPDRVRRRAPLIGPAVVAGVFGVIAALYIRAGIHPFDAYRDALRTGTFQPILTDVRQIHRGLGGGDGPTATIRHIEIRGALCASFLGLALVGQSTRRSLRWPLASVTLAATLALLQFSRANLIIVALFALGPLLVAVRNGGPMVRRAVVGGTVIVLLAMTQIGVVQDALFDGSNNSSEVRSDAFGDAVGLLDEAMFTGITVEDLDGDTLRSPHNMFLDVTLGAGLIGSVAAIALIAVAVRLALIGFKTQLAAASVLETLPAAGATGLMCIVVIRMLTGGGGLLDAVSWFAFGAATALLIVERRAPT